jgi:hypothetical protein
MTFELPSLLDRADNPYMPRQLQLVPLNLDPGDFALLHPLPDFPHNNIALIDGAHGPVITTTGPVYDDADELVDDTDDNSSDSLDSIEDHEFPTYFSQRGSPPRLFHSHGTYTLPVDGDEMKVCIPSLGIISLSGHSISSKKKTRSLRLEAGSSTYPASHDPRKQLRCPHPRVT